ncbi:unnamed protein product [Phytophthora lilii]|uniref:glucose-6-phosphate dehydrogenase (NADP(+)) n=1 Tax=Phytophthora lilii TaxID=2077276 RepID=A0A9W7D9R0_9STRA|nr:unnamed protein product [Phytophthora lilii]
MVNHLQLLLSVAVAPSFDPAIYTAPLSPAEFTRRLHEAQLRFIEALKIPRHDSRLLLLAQYDEYATHYRNEMGHSLDQSDHYTPTAAMIELSCTLDGWRNTTFRLAAAKASDARLLAVTITFKGGVFTGSQNQPCTFTVIIQQAPNADTRRSHRIEWSCDITKELTSLRIPEGWEYLEPFDHHVITPTQPNLVRKEAGYEVRPWELGDEPSAYDVLLQEVSIGSSSHFADLDEVEAAWALWTPVIQATETSTTIDAENQLRQDTTLQHISYPAGTSPWKQTPPVDEPFLAKEEL